MLQDCGLAGYQCRVEKIILCTWFEHCDDVEPRDLHVHNILELKPKELLASELLRTRVPILLSNREKHAFKRV